MTLQPILIVAAIAASRLHWTASYIGIPWTEHGRDHDSCNCWTLVELAMREQRGVELPDYAAGFHLDQSKADRIALFAPIADWPWNPVEAGEEREFDVLIFNRAGMADHAGIVIGSGDMLHVEQGSDSRVESYRDGKWRRRLSGIYRHEALT